MKRSDRTDITQHLARIALAALLLCTLSACALFGSGEYWIKPGQVRPSGKAASLLYYADYVRRLAPAAYAQEVEQAQQLYAREKSDFRLVQYALALSAPGGDNRRAQQLLEPFARESSGQDPELRSLANLLSHELAQRRRLEQEARRAEVGAKRADELEKKVEALKTIEKNLIQRETGAEAKP